MQQQYDAEPAKRNLQLESVAHISVQRQMEVLLQGESPPDIAGQEFLCSLHREFFMWIHPFLDGNGRVARLFTEAYLQSIPCRALASGRSAGGWPAGMLITNQPSHERMHREETIWTVGATCQMRDL